MKNLPTEAIQEGDPIKVLTNWEIKNKSLAKKGLKVGLNDFISQLKYLPQETRDEIDHDLVNQSLPSISELENLTTKTISKVMKRKRIASEEEFLIIKEEVIDLNSNINEDDRQILDSYLVNFEAVQKKINGT